MPHALDLLFDLLLQWMLNALLEIYKSVKFRLELKFHFNIVKL